MLLCLTNAYRRCVWSRLTWCQGSLAVCRSLTLSPSLLTHSHSRARALALAVALFSLSLSLSLARSLALSSTLSYALSHEVDAHELPRGHRQGGLKCGHPSPACQRCDRFVRTIRVLPGHAAGRGVPASCPLILGLRVHYTQFSYLRRSKHNGHFNPCDPCELVSTRLLLPSMRRACTPYLTGRTC